jgi:tRNA threonylcarbamoyladenosine biosynthesis protein TsaB
VVKCKHGKALRQNAWSTFVNILVIDTSTTTAVTALQRDDGPLLVLESNSDRRHGRELLPAIRSLLEKGEIAASELDHIAVGLGPGSYTGLRVGVMAAKTLAYATNAAVLGIDSLEAAAWNAPAQALSIIVAAEAQRGEVHVAEFVRDSAGAPPKSVETPKIVPADRLAEIPSDQFLVLLPGLEMLAKSFSEERRHLCAENAYPGAKSLMEIAKAGFAEGRRDDFWTIEPVYLRRSAAEDQWARLGR